MSFQIRLAEVSQSSSELYFQREGERKEWARSQVEDAAGSLRRSGLRPVKLNAMRQSHPFVGASVVPDYHHHIIAMPKLGQRRSSHHGERKLPLRGTTRTAESVNNSPVKRLLGSHPPRINYGAATKRMFRETSATMTDPPRKKSRPTPRSLTPASEPYAVVEEVAEDADEQDAKVSVEESVEEDVKASVKEEANGSVEEAAEDVEGSVGEDAKEWMENVKEWVEEDAVSEEDAAEVEEENNPIYHIADWLQYDPVQRRVLTAWQPSWISVEQRKFWKGGWKSNATEPGARKGSSKNANYVVTEVHTRGKGMNKEFYVTWKATWEPETAFMEEGEKGDDFRAWLEVETAR